jgi:hypothetical protein
MVANTRFTLDPTCILDLERDGPTLPHIRGLIDAHDNGRIEVGVLALAPSEKHRGRYYPETFRAFEERLDDLGIRHLPLVVPKLYLDIGFLDCALVAHDEGDLERHLHEILHADVEFSYDAFCQARAIDPRAPGWFGRQTWRNAKCDVLALWSHINDNRDVFVTTDETLLGSRSFLLNSLGVGAILRPETAAMADSCGIPGKRSVTPDVYG